MSSVSDSYMAGGGQGVNDPSGAIQDVFSVIRRLVPGETCLWCNELINPTRLAEEAASQEQQAAQRYVEDVPAPSVITLNAVACAHAVDQYLFTSLGLREQSNDIHWLKFQPSTDCLKLQKPRRDPHCSECQGRLGAGRLQETTPESMTAMGSNPTQGREHPVRNLAVHRLHSHR